MTDHQAMDEIFDAVATASGKPVLLHEEPTLKFHSTIRTARGEAPAHVVVYRPDLKSDLPYLAAFQCGFLLRVFKAPPELRFDLAGTPVGKSDARRLVVEQFRRQKKKLPDAVVDQFSNQIFTGLGLQLRSVAVGMRVDDWIFTTYPVLREQQRRSAVRQLNENTVTLGPEVRSMSPLRIFEANATMNAAFAAFWSRLSSDDLLSTPYEAAGFLQRGKELMAIFDEIPPKPDNDKALVESWGDKLGLNGWYSLIHMQ